MIARRFIAATVLAVAVFGSASAQDYGTPAEAQAMAEAAAAYVEEVGPEAAFDAFTNSDAWKDGDLYVFVNDLEGVVVAHGADPSLVGQNLWDTADINGFYFIRAMVAIETTGWVYYVWPDPLTGEQTPKTSYIIRIGNFVLGVGAYLIDGAG